MMYYIDDAAVFLCSLLVLGVFYKNTKRNEVLSFYFCFFAFTTFVVLCNLRFDLSIHGYFWCFYVAQSLYVLPLLLKRQQQKYRVKKVRVPAPKRKVEMERQSIAQ
ncbi:hypothetical protein DFP93_11877 [Aneurinibacillus soli]|uniref:Uncharacterized protein n=1 Tax=Aneurinibacillus soli TaxID=1500254 RepID=A0A0U4WCZ9_9BACL|nr:hypothetical protein [Aneurinibacillus soli]PYE59327.1 hypothetical protein DFP93_11877 [Aneurinibacillus soli]BAU26683.1 hypothetical protein CB4_00826 [Aneurinibacillus soli]